MKAADAWEGAERVLEESDCPVCGRDSCEDPAHLAGVETLTPPTPPALTFETAEAMIAAPPPVEVIEGIVAANSVSVLVGESGASKTFLLLSWAASVADGKPWLGRRVRGGSVGYLSFEGDALGLRLRALREVAGAQLENLYVLRAADPLSPIADRQRGESPSPGEIAVEAAVKALVEEITADGRPPIRLLDRGYRAGVTLRLRRFQRNRLRLPAGDPPPAPAPAGSGGDPGPSLRLAGRQTRNDDGSGARAASEETWTGPSTSKSRASAGARTWR